MTEDKPTTAVEVKQPEKKGWQAGVSESGIQLTNFSDLWNMAQAILRSNMAPKSYTTADQILVGLEWGMEVGLKPMQSLKSIAVIGNTPSIWGDGALAIVQKSPNYEWHDEGLAGEKGMPNATGDDFYAWCTMKRKGSEPYTRKFSVKDAKQQGNWGVKETYKKNPNRMLQMRARAFAMRDKFADALMGMSITEEVMDYDEPVTKRPKVPDQDLPPAPATTIVNPVVSDGTEEAEFRDVTEPVVEAKSDLDKEVEELFYSDKKGDG